MTFQVNLYIRYWVFLFEKGILCRWDSAELAQKIFLTLWVSLKLSKQHDTAEPVFSISGFTGHLPKNYRYQK